MSQPLGLYRTPATATRTPPTRPVRENASTQIRLYPSTTAQQSRTAHRPTQPHPSILHIRAQTKPNQPTSHTTPRTSRRRHALRRYEPGSRARPNFRIPVCGRCVLWGGGLVAADPCIPHKLIRTNPLKQALARNIPLLTMQLCGPVVAGAYWARMGWRWIRGREWWLVSRLGLGNRMTGRDWMDGTDWLAGVGSGW